MRKEITPDMYNYNKFPGPVFVTFDKVVKSDEVTLTILENTSETFDAESFTQRFSEILLKYDYIVGDWGQEQLRLRGFYKDDSQQPVTAKISRLDDYLKEYCNFGCDYFILENLEPVELPVEPEAEPRRSRSRRRHKSTDKHWRDRHYREEELSPLQPFKKKARDPRSRKERERMERAESKNGSFTIRQKGKR